MRSRELYIKAKEQLETELDQEPTSEEIEERSIDIQAKMIDDAYEKTRETE